MKIVVVGCGAAGATAAQFARKTDRKAIIILYDKEGYGQYSKCALPYVIAGKDWKEIVEFPPEWFRRNKIDYRREEVYRIDFNGKIIEGEREEEFDKLVIATGSLPSCPFYVEDAYFLRNIEDAIAIRKEITKAESVIIVGAGLIGLEIAEALSSKLKVKVLEYMPYILPNMLDKDSADYILKKLNIDIVLNCKVEKVEGNKVLTSKGEYEADFVIVAVGNKPNSSLYGKEIFVDEACRVEKDIYAAGDCTFVKDFFGRKINVGLGSIAVRQGMVAGINVAGGNEILYPPVFAKVTKIFGIEIASVGLLSHEIDGIEAKFIGKTLPHYMGGEEIFVKIIAEKDGKIVGCQAVGENAGKIIDKITIAIYNKMNVRDVARIENAYAPSVAPVFDAVSIACNALERKIRKVI